RVDRLAKSSQVTSPHCDGRVFTRLEAGYLRSSILVGVQISWELPTFSMAERCRMSRKDAINSLFLGKTGAASSGKASPARDPERVRSGAIGAMGVSLKELTQGAREAAKLQEQLNSGEHVVLLSPDQIDSSPIADRLPADNDPSYQALRDSIEANGQQIPILVRPSPTAEGRYQVAYGRRRLRVAAELGREVRAIIQALTDAELVVAQGRENLDR